jgi:hypothetical protein
LGPAGGKSRKTSLIATDTVRALLQDQTACGNSPGTKTPRMGECSARNPRSSLKVHVLTARGVAAPLPPNPSSNTAGCHPTADLAFAEGVRGAAAAHPRGTETMFLSTQIVAAIFVFETCLLKRGVGGRVWTSFIHRFKPRLQGRGCSTQNVSRCARGAIPSAGGPRMRRRFAPVKT